MTKHNHPTTKAPDEIKATGDASAPANTNNADASARLDDHPIYHRIGIFSESWINEVERPQDWPDDRVVLCDEKHKGRLLFAPPELARLILLDAASRRMGRKIESWHEVEADPRARLKGWPNLLYQIKLDIWACGIGGYLWYARTFNVDASIVSQVRRIAMEASAQTFTGCIGTRFRLYEERGIDDSQKRFRLLWADDNLGHEKPCSIYRELFRILPTWFCPDDAYNFVRALWENASHFDGPPHFHMLGVHATVPGGVRSDRESLIADHILQIRKVLLEDDSILVGAARERRNQFRWLIDAADKFILEELDPNEFAKRPTLQMAIDEYQKELRRSAASEARITPPTPAAPPTPATAENVKGGKAEKFWLDLTIRVSEDDIIETCEARGVAKRWNCGTLELTVAEYEILQGLAVTGGDLTRSLDGSGLPAKTRQTIRRLRLKLTEKFPDYKGDPIPRGKAAFKIERLTTRAENEIAQLERESRSDWCTEHGPTEDYDASSQT